MLGRIGGGTAHRSVSVTRFGKPVAEIVPPKAPQKASWLGCMKDSMEVTGDIEGPIGAFRRSSANQK
jgi:antitoxin (DNA-binding transcriptional repressor) of toxin-antitoxin stability system